MERAQYPALKSHALKPGTVCLQPSSFSPVKLNSPALNVMTDFLMVTPATVPADAALSLANTIMISRGVRLLLVVDSDQTIIGVVTAHDTLGERPITHIHDRGGKHHELRVSDVMTPLSSVSAFLMVDVLHADVGHILQSLRQLGRQHALVVELDAQTGKEMVRGIFSATGIGRRLGVPVQIFEVANTFAEIEAALATS